MKDQWKQGLQWGGVAWLGYILSHAIPNAAYVPFVDHLVMAVAWIVAAALLLAGARVARLALALAIVAQIVTGTMAAAAFDGPMHLAWALTFWLPMTLPLIPLLFMAPERPRLTVALVLVGRFRDAWQTLAGWRWPIVACVLVSLNREARYLLESIEHDQVSCFYRVPVLAMGLMVVAAIPFERRSITAA